MTIVSEPAFESEPAFVSEPAIASAMTASVTEE